MINFTDSEGNFSYANVYACDDETKLNSFFNAIVNCDGVKAAMMPMIVNAMASDTNIKDSVVAAGLIDEDFKAEYDAYMMIKTLIGASVSKELEINNLFKLDENAQAKKITKTVQALVNKFRFMSTEYNKQGVHTHCQPSDCVIITTPDQLANLNVELLATAFNVPYAEMPSRIVVIDSFLNKDGTDDNDTVCIVADMDLVQFRNTLDTWETFRNPDGLMTNMFHHVWGSACGCGFVNAVKIKNKTS